MIFWIVLSVVMIVLVANFGFKLLIVGAVVWLIKELIVDNIVESMHENQG